MRLRGSRYFQRNSGRSRWNRYFTRSENVRYLWAKLKEIYPDKWIMFLKAPSCRTLAISIGRVSRLSLHFTTRRVSPVYGAGVASKSVARAATDGVLGLVPLKLPAANGF